MNQLLIILLSLSMSGSLLILFLFLCKPLLKEKISKQWQYYIWLIIIARLLLPFAPETNLTESAFRHFDTKLSQMELTMQPKPVSHGNNFSETETPAKFQGDASDGKQPKANVSAIKNVFDVVIKNIWLVWLIVAVALFIRKITVYQSFVKYMKAGRVEVSDLELWERVGQLVERTGVKKTVSIYTNSLISSPLLIGFFCPSILLPTAELSDSDFEYTIMHELTHYKRCDMFYKWLVQFTICLHWFNPLAYLMEQEINRASELACDEVVIQDLGQQGRRAYGDTLLNAVGTGGNYKNALASVTLYENQELLKERLDAIMEFKKASRFTVVFSVVLGLALCFGATAAGAYTVPANPKNQQVSDSKETTINSEGNGVEQKTQLMEEIESSMAPKSQPQTTVFSPDEAGKIVIPVSIKTLGKNTAVCMGEVPNLAYATSIEYHFTCDSNDGVLSAGLRKPTLDSEWFFRIETEITGNNQKVQFEFDNNINSQMGVYKFYDGNYQFYIQNKDGTLSNISGSITIQYSDKVAKSTMGSIRSVAHTDAITISSNGQRNVTQSGSFEAKHNQALTLTIQSNITGATVDFFLFSPSGKEQRITVGGSNQTETFPLTAGRWAYNCTGFFDSGDITIIRKIK